MRVYKKVVTTTATRSSLSGRPAKEPKQADVQTTIQPVDTSAVLLRLQREYGNRFVQQVMDPSRQGEGHLGLMHGLQRQGETPDLQRNNGSKKEAEKEPKLLQDFAAKFPDAAELIRKSEPAMKLVKEAATSGVIFGGYAEEGPAKDAWAYTAGASVYIPKVRVDKVLAMRDFLFELNNAIREPKFAELDKEAAKGAKGKLKADEYAYKTVEEEVEGMLRSGEIWFETKKSIGKGVEWNKYDDDFYLSEYEAFKKGKKTKDDLVKDVLKRVYTSGKDKGKTVEQFYMEQHKELSGSK